MGSCCGSKSIQVNNISQEEKKLIQFQAINQKAKAPQLSINQSDLYKKRSQSQQKDSNLKVSLDEESTIKDQTGTTPKKNQKIISQSTEKIKSKQNSKILSSKSSVKEIENGKKLISQPSKENAPTKTPSKTWENQDEANHQVNKKVNVKVKSQKYV